MRRMLSVLNKKRWLISTLSDAVPRSWLLHKVLYNGKMTAACMVFVYIGVMAIIVLVIWPIHWLAQVLLLLVPLNIEKSNYSEALACLIFILIVQSIGKAIVRFLVFPGSSDRFCSDIASDFASYSIRVLNQVLDAGLELDVQNAQHRLTRMIQYRDRILVVYRDVLSSLYYHKGVVPAVDGEVSMCNSSTSTEEGCCATITRSNSYGTNDLQGDIGPLFPFFLVPNYNSDHSNDVQQVQYTIIQQLSNIISDLDAIEAQLLTLTNNRNAAPHQRQQLTQTLSSLSSHCTSLKNIITTKLFIPKQQQETTDDTKPKSKKNLIRNIIEKVSSFFFEMLDPLYSYYSQHDCQDKNDDSATTYKASAIFTIDVLRGCFLSRYKGAKQFWIPRGTTSKSTHTDGFLDCVIIPPPTMTSSNEQSPSRKAVIYCNPNAGLYELATGFNLMGGNIFASTAEEETNNWTDFYLSQGYHVVLFNYAGYGRSFGDSSNCCWSSMLPCNLLGNCNKASSSPRYHDADCANKFYSWWLQKRFRRVWFSIVFGWKSTSTSHWKLSPDSLKADGLTVANFVISSTSIDGIKPLDKLVIHGESIGGMVAASTAKLLSTSGQSNVPLLLVCDRTFCNLIATAQRLVGGWSGPAIRMLMPFWNTNVAADFQAAKCPKVVANDPADAIIADPSSLRSGLAISSELLCNTKQRNMNYVGLIWNAPLSHRMAEWENIGLYESRFSKTAAALMTTPIWPKDRHFTVTEVFHFAACVRRIFKLASFANTNPTMNTKEGSFPSTNNASSSSSSEGIELCFSGDSNGDLTASIEENSNESYILASPLLPISKQTNYPPVSFFILDVWKILARCDGLYGLTLGSAVQGGGADNIVSWLCSAVVFGCQTLSFSVEKRINNASNSSLRNNTKLLKSRNDWTSHEVELEDFSAHLKSFSLTAPCPIAIPEVVMLLRGKIDTCNRNDEGFIAIERELQYCLEILEYIKARVSSQQVLKSSWENMNFLDEGDNSSVIGSFFRLHCGHNNQFSSEEKEYFKILLRESQNYYNKLKS